MVGAAQVVGVVPGRASRASTAGVCPENHPSSWSVHFCGCVSGAAPSLEMWWVPLGQWSAMTFSAGLGRCWSRRLGAFSFCGCLPFFLSLCRSQFPVLWSLPLPSPRYGAPCIVWRFLALVLSCFRYPLPFGCTALTLRPFSLLGRGSSLRPLLSQCPRGPVVMGPRER